MKQCTLIWDDLPAAVSEINKLLNEGWEIVPSSFHPMTTNDGKRRKIAVLMVQGDDRE